MNRKEFKIEYFVFDSSSQLETIDAELVKFAKEAVENSYSPYSNFAVGAAVRLANGKIVKGSNQENSAYPSGLCAERVALFSAGALYPGVAIEAIAITAKTKDSTHLEPISPCGACRQVMLEYETIGKKSMKVIMHGEGDSCYMTNSVKAILPFSFRGEFLK